MLRPQQPTCRSVAFGLALSLCGATLAQADTPDIGRVVRVENSATARNADAVRDLAAEGAILSGDVLISHAAARLEAVLTDDTRITLGENATLAIDDFVYAPGSQGGSLAVRVLDGAFLFVGGKVEGPAAGPVTIAASYGTLGIRGTTVWGGPLDGGFAVLVLQGEVTVTNAGQTVTLTPNTGTTIADATSAPEAPVVWPQAKVDRALATISFTN